jgi:hypothetical protein
LELDCEAIEEWLNYHSSQQNCTLN